MFKAWYLVLNLLEKFFYRVLSKGVFPENWLIGKVKPIYRKKGRKSDPINYKGITLFSCLSKAFTGIINKILNEFLEKRQLQKECQTGFRKEYSILDHIFNLMIIIQMFFVTNKNLYCAFVDYEKAFDTTVA